MTGELIRMRVLAPGDLVKVGPCLGAYTELPPGLPDGAMTKVVAVDRGYARVVDEAGQEFRVAFPQIDMPRSIWWHGRWIDRFNDPEGERAFKWATGDDSQDDR